MCSFCNKFGHAEHLTGAGDTVADVIVEIDAEFFGSGRYGHKCVPGIGAEYGACRTLIGKRDVLEMFSNRVGVSKVVVLADQAVKKFFKPGSAYLFKMDRKKFINGALYRVSVDLYFDRFFTIGKRISRLTLGRR